MNEKVIKGIGIATTVIGLGVTVLTDWVNEQKIDAKISDKVAEAIRILEEIKNKGMSPQGLFFFSFIFHWSCFYS